MIAKAEMAIASMIFCDISYARKLRCGAELNNVSICDFLAKIQNFFQSMTSPLLRNYFYDYRFFY